MIYLFGSVWTINHRRCTWRVSSSRRVGRSRRNRWRKRSWWSLWIRMALEPMHRSLSIFRPSKTVPWLGPTFSRDILIQKMCSRSNTRSEMKEDSFQLVFWINYYVDYFSKTVFLVTFNLCLKQRIWLSSRRGCGRRFEHSGVNPSENRWNKPSRLRGVHISPGVCPYRVYIYFVKNNLYYTWYIYIYIS